MKTKCDRWKRNRASVFRDTEIRQLLTVLVKIQKRDRDELIGICWNVQLHLHGSSLGYSAQQRLLDYMYRLFPLWSKFSGDCSFPVPTYAKSRYSTPRDIYMNSENLYEGLYGELRIDLLYFVIDLLEKSWHFSK